MCERVYVCWLNSAWCFVFHEIVFIFFYFSICEGTKKRNWLMPSHFNAPSHLLRTLKLHVHTVLLIHVHFESFRNVFASVSMPRPFAPHALFILPPISTLLLFVHVFFCFCTFYLFKRVKWDMLSNLTRHFCTFYLLYQTQKVIGLSVMHTPTNEWDTCKFSSFPPRYLSQWNRNHWSGSAILSLSLCPLGLTKHFYFR